MKPITPDVIRMPVVVEVLSIPKSYKLSPQEVIGAVKRCNFEHADSDHVIINSTKIEGGKDETSVYFHEGSKSEKIPDYLSRNIVKTETDGTQVIEYSGIYNPETGELIRQKVEEKKWPIENTTDLGPDNGIVRSKKYNRQTEVTETTIYILKTPDKIRVVSGQGQTSYFKNKQRIPEVQYNELLKQAGQSVTAEYGKNLFY